jgi:hypothetical protein
MVAELEVSRLGVFYIITNFKEKEFEENYPMKNN